MYEKIARFSAVIRFFVLTLYYYPNLQATGRNYFKSGCLEMAKGTKFLLKERNLFEADYNIEIRGQLKLGSRNYFNKNVKIVCFDKIEIGDDCLFADSVHIYDHDHRFDDIAKPIAAQGYATAPIKIGNNVLLGAKVTVLKGVAIGDGVVVGANSVVTRDLPANSICAGIPAKVLKMR